MAHNLNNFSPRSVSFAAFGMALSIILGAFAAHYLKNKLSPSNLLIFETAVRYQIYGCLGILIKGLLENSCGINLLKSIYILQLGIILFCGSLYFLALKAIFGIEGLKWIGIVTPIGGLCMIVAWLWTAIIFFRLNRST